MSAEKYPNHPDSVEDEAKLSRFSEVALDGPRFRELLDVASSTCLKAPPDYGSAVDGDRLYSHERMLISTLGHRGIGYAFDSVAGQVSRRHEDDTSSKDSDEDLVGMDSILKKPEYFSRPVDIAAQEMTRLFGEKLIEEAFDSLGDGKESKLSEFIESSNDTEQIAVLEWLIKRVQAIGGNNLLSAGETDPEQSSELFYHPIRLSPKALGVYPQHKFNPTCLGKSMLTMSFLTRTGSPTLHTGVMSTDDTEDARLFGLQCAYTAGEPTLNHNPDLQDRILAAAYGYRNLVGYHDTGFHAAGAIRLKSGAWYIIDPNFDAGYRLDEKPSEDLQQAYDDIGSVSNIAPGVERVVNLPYHSDLLDMSYLLLNELELDISDEDLDDLVDGGLPAIATWLRDRLISLADQARSKDTEMDRMTAEMIDFTGDSIAIVDSVARMSLLEASVMEAVVKYYLWGDNPHEVKRRCAIDEPYRQRRKQDLIYLPRMAVLEATKVISEQQYGRIEHAIIEVGYPDYRVGSAVLSDFSRYIDTGISAGFMSSQWASRVPVTDFDYENSHLSSQRLQTNLMSWAQATDLIYPQQRGIIREQLQALPEE